MGMQPEPITDKELTSVMMREPEPERTEPVVTSLLEPQKESDHLCKPAPRCIAVGCLVVYDGMEKDEGELEWSVLECLEEEVSSFLPLALILPSTEIPVSSSPSSPISELLVSSSLFMLRSELPVSSLLIPLCSQLPVSHQLTLTSQVTLLKYADLPCVLQLPAPSSLEVPITLASASGPFAPSRQV